MKTECPSSVNIGSVVLDVVRRTMVYSSVKGLFSSVDSLAVTDDDDGIERSGIFTTITVMKV